MDRACRERGKEGVSQDVGEDESKNFEPGENPESDESNGMKGDNNTADGADEAQKIRGTQDKTTSCQGAPESGTNGGDSNPLEEATESTTNREVEGSNDGAFSNIPEHSEAVVEPLSQLSMDTNVLPQKDKSVPEPSTTSEFASDPKEQEKLSQGTHGDCIASKPEYGNADSDISKSDEDWEHLSAENETEMHEQNDHTSGKEPIKEKSQVHQDDSKASQPEQLGMSDDTVPKEEPNNNPQPNDGPGPSPSSGPKVHAVEAAPGETKPSEFEGDVGKERPLAEVKRLKKNAAEGEQLVSENKANEVKENEQSGNKEDEKRPVSISLCTSAYDFNVKGLQFYLNGLKKERPELIKEVKIHHLPYNDLDSYRFSPEDPIDVMILCHSINNRRFAITDVMDALYDKYLPYCTSVIGKQKMGVIVHDFDDMNEEKQRNRMQSFENKQPKAFLTTSLQVTCGPIEKEEQVFKKMQDEDKVKLFQFLTNASKYPEKMVTEDPTRADDENVLDKVLDNVKRGLQEKWERFSDTGKKPKMNDSSSDSNVDSGKDEATNMTKDTGSQVMYKHAAKAIKNEANSGLPPGTTPLRQQVPAPGAPCQQPMSQSRRNMVTTTTQSSLNLTQSHPRPISVSICSSAEQYNVQGLISWFTKLQTKQKHMIADVMFRKLPYNDIDSFRFPSNDPVDVMVLCHSVDNRGFSITNVMNSIYDKYLKYCHDVIRKRKLAVIVHDFKDLNPETVKIKMESFKRQQPSTFELVDTVILCGSLEIPGKIQMADEEETQLVIFMEKARFEQKENLTISSQSFTNPLAGLFNFSTSKQYSMQ